MTSSFLTTYRNDFLWPFVRTAPLRPGCQGVRYTTVPSPEQALERGLCLEEYERLLEARRRCQAEAEAAVELHAGRPGPHTPAAASPGAPHGYCMPAELQVARNDRAQQNLKMLQEKHPYLFNMIRSCPPDDLVARVFKDRYKSVYQVDYCKQGEYPNSEYDALVAGSGLAGAAPGALPYCPCRSNTYSSDGNRMAVVSLDRNRQLQACEQAAEVGRSSDGDIEVCLCGLVPKKPQFARKCTISCKPKNYGKRPGEDQGDGREAFNQYRTEYRDSYSKLGGMITAENIHCSTRGHRPGS
ncbi:uncharacterized protein LOC113212150 [Frankliniella occidentalis]|uniref:Uncharacterized protein LOC113212150 n=1 Tax=Frankliniella occidentalis TaxID=133901 RepID=A0A6J1T014_FRAOC|nr:uncharacterized protein LOC113212150 [Frankliniella occidentalis]